MEEAVVEVDWETVDGSAVMRSMRVVPAADSVPDAMLDLSEEAKILVSFFFFSRF